MAAIDWGKLSPFNIYKKLDAELPVGWIDWEPETLLREYTFKSQTHIDKVLAVKSACLNMDLVSNDSVAFENVVNAFCNNYVVVDAAQPPYLEEVFYTLNQLDLICKDLHNTEFGLGPQVKNYIAGVAKYRDFIVLPKELDFAQETLDYLNNYTKGNIKDSDYSEIYAVSKAIRDDLADAVIDDPEALDKLSEDTPVSIAIKKIIACYLYDPTKE